VLNSEKDFYLLYAGKSSANLIAILKERSTYRNEAVIAAGKLLVERGIDLESIKDQVEPGEEPEEVFPEQEPIEDINLENYKQEIEEHFQRGADPESIRIALKEKGYNSFEMLHKEIETNENLKAARDGVWKKWVVGAGIIIIVLRILRVLLAQ
jgi:hypothetical protein